MEKTNDVIGLGNALMDFLVEVDDERLVAFGLNKGEMHLVEEGKAKDILESIQKLSVEQAPGGSSANTLRCLASLGGKVIYCGKVGDDRHGEAYVKELEQHGVSTKINKHHKTTGHCVSFITPDSERTMSTHLGAALELYKDDVWEQDIAESKILHLEGYQLEGLTKETVLHAISLAKKHGTLVSVDLADPGLIRRNKDFFKELVMEHADIVFVNEMEAQEFTGLEPAEALNEIAKQAKVAVVKLGEEGSLISSDGVISVIEGFPAAAIDTTGAGDTFAAGFLYGYCQGWGMEKSGRLGSLIAARIVEQKGVKVDGIDFEELKNSLENYNGK